MSGLTVAVTGPTGEIGRAAIAALEAEPGVDRIVGMARRPFDPAAAGWRKTEYRRGDVLDPTAVADLVRDADVVVHLAFVILGSHRLAGEVNVHGTRTVLAATAAAPRARRFVYTSSVAAYGYHPTNPDPLTEDVPARGTAAHYYSRQKAETEAAVAAFAASTGLEAYVLRPCIVGGPEATGLYDAMPWRQVSARLPGVVRGLAAAAGRRVPLTLRPVLPDPGVPLQLVHHDDVARAVVAATCGAGPPGPYNLAGDGCVTVTDVAHAFGAVAVPLPSAVTPAVAAAMARLPFLPAELEWIQVFRAPVLMDTTRAREHLGWSPRYTSRETLDLLSAAVRR